MILALRKRGDNLIHSKWLIIRRFAKAMSLARLLLLFGLWSPL